MELSKAIEMVLMFAREGISSRIEQAGLDDGPTYDDLVVYEAACVMVENHVRNVEVVSQERDAAYDLVRGIRIHIRSALHDYDKRDKRCDHCKWSRITVCPHEF